MLTSHAVLSTKVTFMSDCVGQEVEQKCQAAQGGEVCVHRSRAL
jgi:3-phosphoglycerate kinase